MRRGAMIHLREAGRQGRESSPVKCCGEWRQDAATNALPNVAHMSDCNRQPLTAPAPHGVSTRSVPLRIGAGCGYSLGNTEHNLLTCLQVTSNAMLRSRRNLPWVF